MFHFVKRGRRWGRRPRSFSFSKKIQFQIVGRTPLGGRGGRPGVSLFPCHVTFHISDITLNVSYAGLNFGSGEFLRGSGILWYTLEGSGEALGGLETLQGGSEEAPGGPRLKLHIDITYICIDMTYINITCSRYLLYIYILHEVYTK